MIPSCFASQQTAKLVKIKEKDSQTKVIRPQNGLEERKYFFLLSTIYVCLLSFELLFNEL